MSEAIRALAVAALASSCACAACPPVVTTTYIIDDEQAARVTLGNAGRPTYDGCNVVCVEVQTHASVVDGARYPDTGPRSVPYGQFTCSLSDHTVQCMFQDFCMPG